MNSEQLKSARMERGWNQQEAAKRLGVTQAYLSMLESGRRSTAHLSRKLMQVYRLSPTVLPVQEVKERATPSFLAHELAALGYPGFARLRKSKKANPADFLLTALFQRNLEARVAEGLQWLVRRDAHVPCEARVSEAGARVLQNRLGFVVTLGRLAGG